MTKTINKEVWNNSVKEDFIDKINSLELAIKENDLYKIEYWFVIILTHSLYLIKQCLNLSNNMYFKQKHLIEHAFENGVVSGVEIWHEAINLSNKIGRAVRPKEENVVFIKDFVRLFYDLKDKFDSMLKI